MYLSCWPILADLTVDEYRYATQMAVWAALGQIGMEGTAFTQGREFIPLPMGDLQQMRVFRAIQCILGVAKDWDRVYRTGMYIRLEENELGGNEMMPASMTLEGIAAQNLYGIRLEVINGKSYYTKEYIFASATSTYYQDYTIDLWATGCPAGTIFTDLNNKELPRSNWKETATWRVPASRHDTSLNYNGHEYWGKAKLCIPADTAPPSGEITIHCGAQIMQYEIYYAENDTAREQSYILADPSKSTLEADAVLSWGGPLSEHGNLEITKVDGGGVPLAGAVFELNGTDGSHRTGTTNERGIIRWDMLEPAITYTLVEKTPPAGFGVVDPITVRIKAAHTEYITVQDPVLSTLTVHKQDKQTGYSLRGAVICFEQIDGSFKTTATTDHAGNIHFNADRLPIGSYKVYEVQAPEGYELDSTAQTVHWDGKRDVTLTYTNVRQKTLILSKKDSRTGYGLPDATFDVYRDGQLVTTVTTNDVGLAYVPGVREGYYEVKETVAPAGYTLNSKVYGVNITPYDPATTDDPRLVVENEPLPGLRIVKYDRESNKPLPEVAFKVYRDTVLLGNYTTDQYGEILLTGLEPGTYLVEEVAAPDSHVVNSTPQSIELKAGRTEPATLIFFNALKPGIHLVKVDSKTLAPLPNATYVISKVGGSFAKEYVTDVNGEIDLSKLEPGAYQVRETKAPEGYLVDDGIRTIQLKVDENAQFVFTNTPKPSLTVVKYDPNTGKYLAGATFRITKVEDGSHYLDRVTDTQGRIAITDLEPGVYSIQETAAPAGYVLNPTEYHVELFPGKGSELVVVNEAKPDLRIVKTDAITGKPVEGVTFTVKLADGRTITTEVTNADGEILLTGMDPGVVEIWEQSAPDKYLLNEEHQLITLAPNKLATVYFQNYPKPALTITKLDKATGMPLPGAVFEVRSSSGAVAGNSNGRYTTDKTGTIHISNLVADTYVVKEVQAPNGYEPDGMPQFVKLAAGETHGLTFYNTPTPKGDLRIVKLDETTRQPIGGVEFAVAQIDGKRLGTYRTNSRGIISLTDLTPGWYTVTETKAAEGYALDSQPRDIQVKNGQTATLEVTNRQTGSALIHKIDSTTGKGVYGVTFLVCDGKGKPVGLYTSDQNGYVYISGELKDGKYTIREIQAAEGYILDTTPKTVYVEYGGTTMITWKNTPITGQIQITKTSADYNAVNGWPAGSPIPGTEFEVYSYAGVLVDTIRTDKNGVAISKLLPLGRYKLVESKAADFYLLDATPIEVEIGYAGQIVRAAMTNRSVQTGVSITKTGYAEVMPGQQLRYTFIGIGNTSNVALSSFYWRDSLPVNAVRLSSVTTGTYNIQSSYKVVYRTNLSGEVYRTLADNLSAQNNYTLDASPTTLGLASNEYITEIMLAFGVVPAGFRQMESAYLDCTVLPALQNDLQFTNTADVGGIHNTAWVQANSRWVTKVYAPAKPLPRTGY